MISFTTHSKHQPTISVVLPVYNHAAFLGEAVNSVLTQDGLLELIVVNDGSTDPAVQDILNSYDHPRLKVIHQANGGISAALNRGFEDAQGEFFTWISADNRFKQGALLTMQKFLQQHRKVSLVYANVQLIDQNGAPYQGNSYRPVNLLNDQSAVLRLPRQSETLWHFADNFINACFLYRHDDARFVGYYNKLFRGFEDYDYWLRLSFAGEVAHLDSETALYDYRIHDESLTHNLSWDKMREDCRQLIAQVRQHKAVLEQPLRAEISQETTELPNISSALRACGAWCTQSNSTKAELTLSTETTSLASAELSTTKVFADNFSHQALGQTFAQEVFAVSTFKRQVNAETRLLNLAIVQQQPRLLLRARDDNFFACAPHEGSKRSLLIFCPDFRDEKSFLGLKKTASQKLVSSYAETIKRHSDFTFALYCQTKAERTTADKINLELSDNKNLRIIDVSEQSGDCLQESLLYALSSVDGIFFIDPDNLSDTSSLVELRLLSIVAALANRPLIIALNQPPSLAKGINTSESQLNQFLFRELSASPHCFISSFLAQDLQETILRASLDDSSQIIDEWLETTTLNSLGKRVVSFLACP